MNDANTAQGKAANANGDAGDRATLHFIYDPFCGWCYGVAPLLTEAAAIEGLKIIPHGGGMLAQERATNMSAKWRDFVRPHEERITALSGQQFSSAYQTGTQFDYSVMLDSGPPTAAMLAAEEVSGAGVAMLKKLQSAYYREGRPIADRKEIMEIAAEVGLDVARFAPAFATALETLDRHFEESGALLVKLGGQGYPTLALQQGAKLHRFHLAKYLGKPDQFRKDLDEMLGEPKLA